MITNPDRISEIELRSTHSKEQVPPESQLSANPPLLDLLQDGERNDLNSKDRFQSLHGVISSTALDRELPNAPLLEKNSELSLDWPTSPKPVTIPLGISTWNIFTDFVLMAFSVAFLAFALFVIWYNGKPTSHHQQAAMRIEQASTWVSICPVKSQYPSAH